MFLHGVELYPTKSSFTCIASCLIWEYAPLPLDGGIRRLRHIEYAHTSNILQKVAIEDTFAPANLPSFNTALISP